MLNDLLVALQHRKDGIFLIETAPVALEALDISELSTIDKEMEEALAGFISPGGTFV